MKTDGKTLAETIRREQKIPSDGGRSVVGGLRTRAGSRAGRFCFVATRTRLGTLSTGTNSEERQRYATAFRRLSIGLGASPEVWEGRCDALYGIELMSY